LWISFLITKNFNQLDTLIFEKDFRLVLSQELLDEFIEVSQRPKFRRFFSQAHVLELLEFMQEFADFVVVTSKSELCRDPKDNFLLSLAVDSHADYLITGDKDLLEISSIQKTQVLTVSELLKSLS